ncbi:MAG: hypothetical protein J6T59_03845 [Bacteroidales bacterium]|nr:hypothetical protein [Bacteroidales bacterium]
MTRLLQPMLKEGLSYHPISFEDAYSTVASRCSSTIANQTLVMVSGDYSNEELYLLQRLARAGLHTNAITSFEYFNKSTAFFFDKNDIVPFAEILGASRIFIAWTPQADTPSAHAITHLLTSLAETPQYWFNQNGNLYIQDYTAFFRCLNRYLVEHNLAEGIYINGLGKNYDTYKAKLLADDYEHMLAKNNLSDSDIANFVSLLEECKDEVFVVWEPLMSERAVIELENLCMLLDIQSKPNAGFLCIKPTLNAQGLFDMGCFPSRGVGSESLDEMVQRATKQGLPSPCIENINVEKSVLSGSFNNYLLFNSTGLDIPSSVLQQIRSCSFSMLHTAEWDEKDTSFDLLIPAARPEEVTGSFTDSARIPHQSIPDIPCPFSYNNIEQFNLLNQQLHLSTLDSPSDAFLEFITLFKAGCHSQERHFFR